MATLLGPNFPRWRSSRAQAAPYFADHNGIRRVVGRVLHPHRADQVRGFGRKKMLELGGVLRGSVGHSSDLVRIVQDTIPHVDDSGVAHPADAVDRHSSPSLTLRHRL